MGPSGEATVAVHNTGTFARLLLWLVKAVALWLALLVAAVVAGKLLPGNVTMPPQDGPLTGLQALLLVNGAVAAALALLAQRARVGGWRLAVLIFVVLYGMQSFMMIIEGLWFNNTLRMPMLGYVVWGVRDAGVAAVVGILAATLFRRASGPAGAVPSGIFWRLLALAAIYVFLYFGAGMWAWQHDVLRHYYAHMQISFGPTVALQFARGFLWAVIALFVACRIKGSLMSRVFVMAVLFGVLTTMQLLYPNPVMPWAIRQIHLVEVGASEILFGAIAPLVLLAGASRRPLSPTSLWRLVAGQA